MQRISSSHHHFLPESKANQRTTMVSSPIQMRAAGSGRCVGVGVGVSAKTLPVPIFRALLNRRLICHATAKAPEVSLGIVILVNRCSVMSDGSLSSPLLFNWTAFPAATHVLHVRLPLPKSRVLCNLPGHPALCLMPMQKLRTRLCIIGSGPAAHTAAIYAGRAELDPLLFEAGNSRRMHALTVVHLPTQYPIPMHPPLNHNVLVQGYMANGVAAGGQLTTTTFIENFPG